MTIFHKSFHFKTTKVESEDRNGVPIGIIEGYLSTWDLDRGNDRIVKGAFAETIKRHKQDGRQVRMYAGHDDRELIGGFPIEFVREDDKGLFVRGEINLIAGHKGEWYYSLAKQGVLCDMSIGYSVPDRKNNIEVAIEGGKTVNLLKVIELWEGSLVPEPMNPKAQILAVKKLAVELPIAPRDTVWNYDEACLRVKALNSDNEHNLFTDVVDGVLSIVPKAVFKVAAALHGIKNSVDLTPYNCEDLTAEVKEYYTMMEIDCPIGKCIDFSIVESCQTPKEVEQLLKYSNFSQQAAKVMVKVLKAEHREDGLGESDESLNKMFDELSILGASDQLKLTMKR